MTALVLMTRNGKRLTFTVGATDSDTAETVTADVLRRWSGADIEEVRLMAGDPSAADIAALEAFIA